MKYVHQSINLKGIYKPKQYEEKYIDLATLVCRIGGTGLLSVFNKLGMLPSRSVVGIALKNKAEIDISYNKSISEIIRDNFKLNFQQKNDLYCTVKLDELAIIPRVRWNSNNNETVGTCFNHKNNQKSYEFSNELILHDLKTKLKEGKIHLAKESLMVAISGISDNQTDKTPRIICNFPICSHKNRDIIKKVIQEIDCTFSQFNPHSKLVNFATDGDPNRRNILNEMHRENERLIELKSLKHFDQKFLLGKYGINFDPKHIVKSLRSSFLGKQTFQLNKLPISSEIIKFFLKTKIEESQEHIFHLMDPIDKQNVPSAVKFLKLMDSLSINIQLIENPVEKDQMSEI